MTSNSTIFFISKNQFITIRGEKPLERDSSDEKTTPKELTKRKTKQNHKGKSNPTTPNTQQKQKPTEKKSSSAEHKWI